MDIIRVPGDTNVTDSGQNNVPNPWHSDTLPVSFFALDRDMEREKPQVMKFCLMCDKVGILNCFTCDAPYCSELCQEKDFKIHESICSQLTGEFHDCQRPDGQHFRVLFFPQNEDQPRFLWIKHEASDEEVQKTMHRIIVRDCEFQPRQPTFATETRAITINHSNAIRRCGHGLRLNSMTQMKHYNAENGGPVINKALARLSPAGHASVLFGPAILWGYHYRTDAELHDPKSRLRPMDVGARDIRSLMDYMLGRMTNPCVVEPQRLTMQRRVPLTWAVKVNCEGDVARFKRVLHDGVTELPIFESVKVIKYTMDPWITVGWAKILGLHWEYRQVWSNRELKESGRMELLRNPHTRYFTAETLQPGDHLGPDAEDKFQLGTVVVRRRDGGLIHPYHVQWMVDFLDKIRKERGQRRLLLLVNKFLNNEPIPHYNREDMEWDWRNFRFWCPGGRNVGTPWNL
ncbi:hypothetical protein PFICI_13816 [Pestalotiopsis fici W106-1]|uniref:Suppressor of anucleate metulae protein B n=1 Tax=Pestalotiopsis fici (strain W106-1 / CGMCC3.15140) TaxID=1229662 RepID=W3WJ45_PESFW|nr:uncharacterized protein PFICI_13816 [Pestalotiopsis fici W106-1]ETS73950.1 hypothetical protein PFICI_13816 [Pestalotiopsis fici W106-1]